MGRLLSLTKSYLKKKGLLISFPYSHLIRHQNHVVRLYKLPDGTDLWQLNSWDFSPADPFISGMVLTLPHMLWEVALIMDLLA